ncbi:MAG: hypothetical protein HYS23_11770 [Geobacter sp.]|nr:hypothetical protein [Geobacter sp.]
MGTNPMNQGEATRSTWEEVMETPKEKCIPALCAGCEGAALCGGAAMGR